MKPCLQHMGKRESFQKAQVKMPKVCSHIKSTHTEHEDLMDKQEKNHSYWYFADFFRLNKNDSVTKKKIKLCFWRESLLFPAYLCTASLLHAIPISATSGGATGMNTSRKQITLPTVVLMHC